ncbi:LamG-like jellyroll fold domain-containing protein [Dactylosporangium sp. NPDC005555]|uniref:LamG-like jellyroll fold domain-containing protein n=1 Tax=Dactylosporangium sp. NPDC005555 TaxID=3154889 RepID=UPI0033B457F4
MSIAAVLTAAAVINWPQFGGHEPPTAPPPAAGKPAQQQPGATAAEVPTAQLFTEAKRTSKPVEILERRTQTTEYFANPSGTYTMRQYTVPVRVQRGKAWVPVDLALQREPDGGVRSKAGPVDLTFSGGGNGDVVRVRDHGREFTLTWPKPLPEPRLDGDSVVYPEVLPGIDLRVTAQRTGFSKLFVVKDRAAADSEALRRLTLGVKTKELTLTARADGGFVLKDREGNEVFAGDPPSMWDTPLLPADATEEQRLQAQPAHTATARSVVTGRDITIVPDRAMLGRSDLNFPVFVDPSAIVVNNGAWTHINSANPSKSYWSEDRDRAKVGYSYWATTRTPWRSFFLFGTPTLSGKQVTRSTFSITLDHSASCGDTLTYLYSTANVYGSNAVTWNNSSGSGTWNWHLGSQGGHANQGNGCAGGNQPDMNMYWSSDQYPAINSVVQNAANGAYGAQMTFGLRAVDEGDRYQWKQFMPFSAALTVEYNSTPNVPAELDTVPPTGCGSEQRPTRMPAGMLTPTFTALLNDTDANTLHGELNVLQGATETVVHSAKTLDVANGSSAAWHPVPAGKLTANTLYSYRARTNDGTGFSAWSNRCFFIVDNQGPGLPTIDPVVRLASDPAGPEDFPNGVPIRNTGETGSIAFRHATGDTDIAGYRYGFAADKLTGWVPAQEDGDATVPITLWTNPETGYPEAELYVQAEDRAGNVSLASAEPYYLLANDNGAVPTAKRGDVNGDGKGDISAIIDAGGDRLRAWTLTSDGAAPDGNIQLSTQTVGWDTGRDGSSFVTMRFVGGDFTGDGLSDHALFRQDPDGRLRLYLLQSKGNRFDVADIVLWTSPAGDPLWTLAGIKAQSGDFDGDGDTDIAVLRENGAGGWNIYRFDRDPGTGQYNPTSWRSQAFGWVWGRYDMVAGDFDANGHTDLALLKANGATTEIWKYMSGLVGSNGVPTAATTVAADYDRSHFAAGNFDGDTTNSRGRTDLLALTETGATTSSLTVVTSTATGSTVGTAWPAGTAFDSRKVSQLQSADFNADGRDDLAAFAGGQIAGVTQLWTALSGPTEFAAPTMQRTWTVSEKPERRAAWRFDETGTGVFDDYGDNPATVSGGATRGPGRTVRPGDQSLALNGTNQYAATTQPVVRTDRGFSVAAWVKLNTTGGYYTAVEQQGVNQSGFILGYAPGQWRFLFTAADSGSTTYLSATAAINPVAGVWTHLAGVYDESGVLRLYVNGVLAATGSRPTPWNAYGPLQIGRSKLGAGAGIDHFPGSIDDVDVFDHAATAHEIATLATTGTVTGSAGASSTVTAGRSINVPYGYTDFQRGANGHIIRFTATTTASVAEQDWGGSAASQPVVFQVGPDVDVFFRSTDNHLWNYRWSPTNGLTKADWGAGATGGVSGFAYNGERHVFTPAADGTLRHWYQKPGQAPAFETWNGAPAADGTPSAFLTTDNRFEVFVRNTANHLLWWEQPRTMTAAPAPVAFANAQTVFGDPTALVVANQINVFARVGTTPGKTVHRWYFTSTGPSTPISDVNWGGGAFGQPTAVSWATNEIWIYAQGTDNHLWRWNGRSGAPTTITYTSFGGGTIYGPPSVHTDVGAQHYVFAHGQGGTLQYWYWYYTGQIGWGDWSGNLGTTYPG